jgi:hypothetical protein
MAVGSSWVVLPTTGDLGPATPSHPRVLHGLGIKTLYLIAQEEFARPVDCPRRQRGKPLWIGKKHTQFLGQSGRNTRRIEPRCIDDDSGLRRDDVLRPTEIEASDWESLAKGLQDHPSGAVMQTWEEKKVVGIVET